MKAAESLQRVACAAVALAPVPAVHAGVLEFTDRDAWFDAVTQVVTTIGFTGFPCGTVITDQFEEIGVLFTDGDDFAICCGPTLCPNDEAGLSGLISVSFTTPSPQMVIGMDFASELMISLFNDGLLIYTSSAFGGAPGTGGHFAGLISTQPFDAAVIINPPGSSALIDDLHYVAGVLTPCSAGSACEAAKLVAPDGDNGDILGSAVSVWADVVVAGAPSDNNTWGADAGAAYVFRFNQGPGWEFQQKLLAPDGASLDWLGHAVSVAGDVLAVGAPFHDDGGTNTGAVYVFRDVQGQWVFQQKLLAPDAAPSDDFGWAVAVEPGPPPRIVASAAFDDDNGFDAGSVYVFRFDERTSLWQLEQKLLAADGAVLDNFGISVAVDAGPPLRIVAGAYNDDDNGFDAGSAYVFRFDEQTSLWQQEQKLLAADGQPEDQFGSAVSLSGDAALVGAAWDDDNGDQAGSAYVFRFDEGTSLWQQQQKLLADDLLGAGDKFGISVALSGPTAVIGAFLDDDTIQDAGAVYIFGLEGTGWVQQQQLLASDGDGNDFFGRTVATWRQQGSVRIAVGAPGERPEPLSPSVGAVYVFTIAPGPGDLDCDGRVGIQDLLTLLAAWGSCTDQENCPPDLDCDGTVGITDFLTLLQSWGP